MFNRWLQVSLFTLALLVLGISVVKARAEELVKGEMVAETASGSAEFLVEANPDLGGETNYYLAYPGILPDHPFYWLKMLRDRVVEWLTVDEGDKLGLWRLYADKRVGAAKALLEGGKEELGLATGMKSIGYQEMVVREIEALKSKGEDVGEVANVMERATMKHAEVWSGLGEKASETMRPRMDEYHDKTMKLNERLQVVLERK